jgi:hypothetical protein
MQPALKRETPEDERSYVERIQDLLEEGNLSSARALVHEALERGADEEGLSLLQEILAPPRITRSQETDADRAPELRWLDANWTAYRGEWVALEGERLLAHSPDLSQVVAVLREAKPQRSPLLHHIS